jgi:hypothetical protein
MEWFSYTPGKTEGRAAKQKRHHEAMDVKLRVAGVANRCEMSRKTK